MRSATIVIPTLNEEGNVDALMQQLNAVSSPACDLKILFVDDQSDDQTVAKVHQWQQKQNNVDVLQRTGPRDLTQSVIDGAEYSQSDFVLVMDADLSHPSEKIPALLQPLVDGTHDLTVGSRYVNEGGIADWPLHRRFLSWFGGLPARIISDVKDTTSGFFACRKESFQHIAGEAKGYKVLLELMVAGLDQLRVKEVPIVFTDRVAGESKLGSAVMIQYMQRLLELSGGNISGKTAGRFALVGILGVFIDAFSFSLMTSQGIAIGNAHVLSFIIAALSNFVLNSRWSYQHRHESISSCLDNASKFLFFGLLALTLRGGVIHLLVSWGISAHLAIYPAIVAAALVNYFGASFVVFGHKQTNAMTSINWRVISTATVGFIVALRFLYLGGSELIPDEAYYWSYAQHLDWSYLDHPPLLAWLIAASCSLFGDNEFAVRLPFFIAGMLTLWFAFKLADLLFDRTTAFISCLLIACLPIFFSTGFLATTDSLQATFWMASLYFLARIFLHNKEEAWLPLGLVLGLGMLSKYTLVLLLPGILLLMLFKASARHWFKNPRVYVAALCSLAIFSPVLFWNYQTDWSSFSFQTVRRLDREIEFSAHYLILHSVILLSPIGFYLAIKALFKLPLMQPSASTAASNKDYQHFVWCFFALPLTVFIYFSLTYYPRFHWTAPIWLLAVPFMAHLLSPSHGMQFPALSSALRKATLYSIALLCILYGGLLHISTYGPPPGVTIPLSNHYFWRATAAEVTDLENQLETLKGQRPVVISLSKWSIASALNFYDTDGRRDNILSRNAIGESATMYEQWTQPSAWQGHPVIFVAMNKKDITQPNLDQYADGLGKLQTKVIMLGGNEVRTLYYRLADSYQAR
jgi:dolichol-phosphate mannosyltransferase|tara:strand:+ start:120844 stop:123432 length:2589 start_codon:yes stop_codon:yes gene_type:complete